MSASGGKADMTVCGSPLSRSLLGVTRTWFAPHMSAFDPKRTWCNSVPYRPDEAKIETKQKENEMDYGSGATGCRRNKLCAHGPRSPTSFGLLSQIFGNKLTLPERYP